jgi:membrane protease YdiL (CAAX protease family)
VHEPERAVPDLLAARPASPWFGPLAVGLGVAVNPPLQAFFLWVQKRYPLPVEQSLGDQMAELGMPSRVAMGVGLVLLSPLFEEILFRGALFGPVVRRHDRLVAVLASATLFAQAHSFWQMFLPVLAFGLVLAHLRERSGSLLPGVVAHMTFNAVSFYETWRMAEKLPPLGWLTEPTPASVAASAGACAACLLGVHLVSQGSADARAGRDADEVVLAKEPEDEPE